MLAFSDSHDRYGALADLAIRYTILETPIYNAAGGVRGGGSVQFSGGISNDPELQAAFESALTLDASSRMHGCFWIQVHAFAGDGVDAFRVTTNQHTAASAFTGSGIIIHADGSFSVEQGGAGGVAVDTSDPGVLVAGEWQHLEFKANFRDASGIWQVWIDGTEQINFTGDTNTGTQPTSWTGFAFRSVNNGFNFSVCQFVFWDESGTDFAHTGPLGQHVIRVHDIDGDSAVQFVPSAGSNFENVNDVPFHDGDATYNESVTVGDVDLFTLENQSEVPVDIFAIVLHTRARKTDIGGATLRGRIKHGTTTAEGSDYALTSSYTHKQDAWGKNPDTLAVWEDADVDTLLVGYEYQA